MKHVIVLIDKDEDKEQKESSVFWTTRVGDTDNYTPDMEDATLFSDRSAAIALMRTLGLDQREHRIEEIPIRNGKLLESVVRYLLENSVPVILTDGTVSLAVEAAELDEDCGKPLFRVVCPKCGNMWLEMEGERLTGYSGAMLEGAFYIAPNNWNTPNK